MEFVEERLGGLYVSGSRISLATIIHAFRNGDSPETIQRDFPSLTLGQVYGAIGYYLTNEAQSAAYLEDEARLWREIDAKAEAQNLPVQAKLRLARAAAAERV